MFQKVDSLAHIIPESDFELSSRAKPHKAIAAVEFGINRVLITMFGHPCPGKLAAPMMKT